VTLGDHPPERRAPSGLLPRALAVACAAATALLVLVPSAAAAPREPLGHVGRWVTDSKGRVVMLRGVAVVPANGSFTPEGLGFGRDDAAFLRSQGFNVVRLGLFSEAWERQPGTFDADYLDTYLRTHRVLARAGIFSVVDFHQDMLSERFQGRGFADWFIQDDGVANQPQAGFPGNYFVNPALNRAYDNLWANVAAPDGTGVQDHFAEGWRRVAAAFVRRDHVAGYDLLNEPWPGSRWPSCANPEGCPPGGFDQTDLTAFSNRIIAAIRRADAVHLAFYEPNLQFDVGAATRHGKVDDPNVGMSFHNYCLGAAPGLPRVPDPANLCRDVGERGVFQNAEDHSAETGATLLMTEFGDTRDAEIHQRMADLADDFMVGWTQWAYIGSGGGPLIQDPAKPPAGANIDQDMLAALVRPYPQVVAGTPERFGFDRQAKRFTLRFTTRLANGGPAGGRRTEVFVPRLHYPRRYRAELAGGELIGGLGTDLLVLRACPGRAAVELTVTAAKAAESLTCSEQPAGADGGGPGAPARPTGRSRRCPRGNSRTVRCSRTTLADGRRATLIVGTRAREALVGTPGRDVIVCGSKRDRVRAGSGDDTIRCGSGGDRIAAGRGNDRIFAGRGHDRVFPGPGRDRVRTGSGDDRIAARDGQRDRIDCDAGRDRATADRRDAVGSSCERARG
jgi:endoglycosylceramidase